MFAQLLSSISAVSSSLTNQGAPASFKFVVGHPQSECGVYTLCEGKAKSGLLPGAIPISLDDSMVSIFVFKKNASESFLTSIAQTAMKKLVSLRHPGVVRVLDSAESDTGIYIATEWVEKYSKPSLPPLGLFQVMHAVQFLHADCKLMHGSLETGVFVTATGGFKLACFELSRPLDSNMASVASDKRAISRGKLLLSRTSTHEQDLMGYMALVKPVPSGIPEICDPKIMAQWMARTGSVQENEFLAALVGGTFETDRYPFFGSNDVIWIVENLESIHLKSETESVKLLQQIAPKLVGISDEGPIIMDLLLTSVLTMSVLTAAAIPLIVSIGAKMDVLKFQKNVAPKFLPLFQIQDRSVRFRLLVGLPELASQLDPKVIDEQIVPELLSGFTDSHPSLREQTMKTLELLTSTVSISTIEKRLIPNFIKMLRDAESSIRTGAILGLTKLSSRLDVEKKLDVIGACIVAGLKDEFPPANLAALDMVKSLELNSTRVVTDCVKKFVPLVAALVVRDNREVRTAGFTTLDRLIADLKPAVAKHCQLIEQSSNEQRGTLQQAEQRQAEQRQTEPRRSSQQFDQGRTEQRQTEPRRSSQQYEQSRTFQQSEQRVLRSTYQSPPPLQATSVPLIDVDFDAFWADISAPTNIAKPPANSLI